jgi:hypothetical protein
MPPMNTTPPAPPAKVSASKSSSKLSGGTIIAIAVALAVAACAVLAVFAVWRYCGRQEPHFTRESEYKGAVATDIVGLTPGVSTCDTLLISDHIGLNRLGCCRCNTFDLHDIGTIQSWLLLL